MNPIRHHVTRRRAGAVAVTVGVLLGVAAIGANAIIQPGTPGKDVTFGLDNDNADNTFVQPPGVVAKQHMDNTDVLFGRDNDDLLVAKLGDDVLVGGTGDDILVGGPENFTTPNSDVILGDKGNDINVWAPGDGSDAFVGDKGYDTMVFAPFELTANGNLKLESYAGRKIPRVDIGDKPQFSCRIVKVPPQQKLGAQFLVRFLVSGTPVVTVRQKDVERVLCPSPLPNKAKVAYLRKPHPSFSTIHLDDIRGTLGAIVAAP